MWHGTQPQIQLQYTIKERLIMNFCIECGKELPFKKLVCETCREKQMNQKVKESWGNQ